MRGFFDIPPAVMTYLTPKFRLYRVGNKKGESIEEVEFVFESFTDLDRKTKTTLVLQINFLMLLLTKGSGCGLKEFSFEFNGTNPAEARNDITANLSLFFQSFNDFCETSSR